MSRGDWKAASAEGMPVSAAAVLYVDARLAPFFAMADRVRVDGETDPPQMTEHIQPTWTQLRDDWHGLRDGLRANWAKDNEWNEKWGVFAGRVCALVSLSTDTRLEADHDALVCAALDSLRQDLRLDHDGKFDLAAVLR
jgi:hypothetical protein